MSFDVDELPPLFLKLLFKISADDCFMQQLISTFD